MTIRGSATAAAEAEATEECWSPVDYLIQLCFLYSPGLHAWDSTVHGGPGPPTSISNTADAHRPIGWRQFLVGAFLPTGVSRFASDKNYVIVCPPVSPGFVPLLSLPNKFPRLRYFSDICKEIPWDCQLPVNSAPH